MYYEVRQGVFFYMEQLGPYELDREMLLLYGVYGFSVNFSFAKLDVGDIEPFR